mmetsp:Transcript_49152/g.113905  ORF Transcript_49152/g.113905 Transcript_49152/m.113905 type:complete len:283 (+) Transcript_49152:201-1049(+)
MQPSLLPVLPAVDPVDHTRLLGVVEGADERARLLDSTLLRAFLRIDRLVGVLAAQKAALQLRGWSPQPLRRLSLLLLLLLSLCRSSSLFGLCRLGLRFRSILQALLQLRADAFHAEVRETLLAGLAALRPVLGLSVAHGLVGPEDSRVVATDVRLVPDGSGLGVGLQGFLVLALLERSVAIVLEDHSLLALFQQQVYALGCLVELRAYLFMGPPRRHGHLAEEGLERGHALGAQGGLAHALGLRGVASVVQDHGNDCPWLFTHWGQPQVGVVAAGDPGHGHM